MKNTGRKGVSAVQSIVYNDLGWSFREQIVDDYGIDAEIEVADQNRLTGKVIAAQIKSGNSYFKQSTKDSITFYFDETHKNYWLKHILPVIVLLYHPISKECIWEVINELTVKQSEKGYKIAIPKENQFGVPTKAKLLILAYCKNIEDLAEEIDDLDVDKELVFSMLDEKQKETFNEAREIFDKKNAASDSVPFEYKREELFDFVNTITWFNKKNNIFVSSQFAEFIRRIELFVCSTQTNPLIILGEAGIGKTTLVKAFIEKYKEENNILYIQPRGYRDILDEIQKEYEINNGIRVIIIDGWDELYPGEELNVWHKLTDWQRYHNDVKFIITSRQVENYIWEKADFLRIHPLSQMEALAFLNSITGDNFALEESVIKLVNTFNTPLLLQTLVMVTKERGIPLAEATMDNLLFSLISHYSEEDSRTLENIAFQMMQENKMTITSESNRYLKPLNQYAELYIEKNQISFSHMAFYEIFAAKYIYRHIFKGEKTPEDFSTAIWDVFSNTLCPIGIFNYLKYIIKHENISSPFLDQLNCSFSYILEQICPNTSSNVANFQAISNVFYTIWHIVSYVNRIHYGVFMPKLSKESETNLACFINVFNRVYFGKKYLDFSYVDLSNIQLWRCNLINMNFKHSKLYHANFLGCCMEGSNFQQADLSDSNLVAADLRHANLKNAILTGTNVANCMISEDSLEYFLPYRDTLRHAKKLIVFMNDGTTKHFIDI